MKIEAAQRLMAYDNRWADKAQRKINLKHVGEQPPVKNTDQALFTLQPTALAQALKNRYKDDFGAAMSAISFYMNRGGKDILSTDRHRLTQAKEALRKLYGKDQPGKEKDVLTEVKPSKIQKNGIKSPSKPIGAKCK